jgi:type IV pilus assembly protein PilB
MKFNTGLNTEAILVDEHSLQKAIAAWTESQDDLGGGLDDLDSEEFDDLDVAAVDEDDRGRR